MNPSTALSIREAYEESLTLLLHLVEQVAGDAWRGATPPGSPPIDFHVWQTAREADVVQYLINLILTGEAHQIWSRDQLALAWGFNPEQLGLEETGIGLYDEEASSLAWPSTASVAEYAREAFQAVHLALNLVHPDDLDRPCMSPQRAVFGGASSLEVILLRASASANRHLGIVAWRTANHPPAAESLSTAAHLLDAGLFNGHSLN